MNHIRTMTSCTDFKDLQRQDGRELVGEFPDALGKMSCEPCIDIASGSSDVVGEFILSQMHPRATIVSESHNSLLVGICELVNDNV